MKARPIVALLLFTMVLKALVGVSGEHITPAALIPS